MAIAVQCFLLSRQTKSLAQQIELLQAQAEAVGVHDQRDHRRRSQQATIEYWTQVAPLRNEFSTLVARHLQTEVMTPEIAESLSNFRYSDNDEAEIVEALTRYLAGLEYFATGVNSGVFDIDTADALCGSRLLRAAANYRTWIAKQRNVRNQPTLYIELEKLTADIQLRRAGSMTKPLAPTTSGNSAASSV